MSWETFEAAIRWARDLGGPELSFTGMGEAVLHPDFAEMLRAARSEMSNTWFLLATNGVALTSEIVEAIRETGTTVYVSAHRPEIAGPAAQRLRYARIDVRVNDKFATSGFDWAGQVEWPNLAEPSECKYLGKGWATVLQNGDVVNCCFDAHGLYPAGNVRDTHLPEAFTEIPLCASCHLRIAR